MKSKKNTNKNVRLSKEIRPLEYDIKLKPDLENFTFEGIETISLELLKSTKNIVLHSKELEIETAEILLNKVKTFAKISYNEKSDAVIFNFPKIIPEGKYKFTLVFKGILNDKMRGFYKSSYKVGDKINHMATTQFEATDARRAFPCFDEPAQKAIFHVSLIVPKGKTAISNTLPVSVKEHDAGFDIVKFSPTPKMSTYLLAFIVGDLEYIESKTKKGVQVRVFTTIGKKHQAEFALDCAVKTLEFYEEYFDIAYPLPTLDMIAIPDFASGAMENWGAITYRESALLVDPIHSSASNKQWVALVVAHELAHQWFGNLVTMEWWTHLWLNEGFASYIEYLAVDKLFPTWDIWTQFSTNDLGIALRLDSLKNTHPIEVPVHHPDEIGEIFDEVSYSKGASVIRMLAQYLGEEGFRDGLRYYLKRHSYKNTETIHLWEAFEKISKKPVSKIMKEWTSRGGYPVLKAEIQKNNITLTQERFFVSPVSKSKNKDKNIWQIPVTSGTDIFEEKILMSKKTAELGMLGTWTKINLGETGFFRTAYSKELLENLKIPVKEKLLSPRDRLGIVRDLFALAEAGVIPTSNALDFLEAYKKEDNYTVWVEIATGLSRINQLIAKTPNIYKLENLTIKLFSPIVEKLGWNKKDGELHSDTLLRSLAIGQAGRAGDKKIISEAKKQLAKIKKGGHISPDIRSAIYSIIATHGGKKEYESFVKQYKDETLHEEKNRIGAILGDFKSPLILENACKFSMSEHVRTQDTVGIISSVGANPNGRDIWWNFIQKNWKTLVSRYGDGGHTLGRLIKAISASPEQKHLSSFKKFFTKHDAPGAKRAIEQVLERLEGNILWLKRDGKNIAKTLKEIT